MSLCTVNSAQKVWSTKFELSFFFFLILFFWTFGWTKMRDALICLHTYSYEPWVFVFTCVSLDSEDTSRHICVIESLLVNMHTQRKWNNKYNMCTLHTAYTRRTPNSCHDFKLHTQHTNVTVNYLLLLLLLFFGFSGYGCTIIIMIWYESRLRMQIRCYCPKKKKHVQ